MNNILKRYTILTFFLISAFVVLGQTKSNHNSDKQYLYSEVDRLPMFKSNSNTLMKYIYKNLNWPNNFDGRGTVIASFVVKKDGNVSNIKIERKLFIDCDSEVRRVLEMMPRWIPGKVNNKNVDVIYYIPIHFRLN